MSFLASYINKENPDIEEVLLDGELFSEIKTDNKVTANYIIKHFNKVLDYITIEPEISSSSKRSLNIPFVVSEILCLNMKDIQARLMNLPLSKKKDIENKETILSPQSNTSKSLNSLPDFFQKFFDYVDKTEKEVLIESTLPGYCFKIMKKIVKSNFKEFLKVFSNEENYQRLIKCLQGTIFLDSAADILILLYANETEEYSNFKMNLTKHFISFLNSNLLKINSLIVKNLSDYKTNGKIDLKTSLMFDSVENILKYFMKQMKVMTLIETNKNTRDSILVDIIFQKEYLDNLKLHIKICQDNWNNLKDFWEITRCINSIVHYITTSIIYLSNKQDFDDKKVESCLSLFLFDEILDLDLIADIYENGTDKKEPETFKNNFYLGKEDSHKIIDDLVSTFFSSCVGLCQTIGNEGDFEQKGGRQINVQSSKEINIRSSLLQANTNNEIYFRRASQFYLLTLDFTILLLLNHEVSHSVISLEFLEKICEDYFIYHNNTFFLNKVNKIFEIIIYNKKNVEHVKNFQIDECIFSQIIKSEKILNLIKNIQLENFYKEKEGEIIFSNKYYNGQLNSAQSFIFLKQLKEVEEIKGALEEKKSSIEVFEDLYQRKLDQKKQNISELKISTDETLISIEKYECKLV